MVTPAEQRPRIAIFMPSLTGGGAEIMLLRLAEEFVKRGNEVDLVLSRVRGDFDRKVPKTLDPIRLRSCSALTARRLALRAAGRDWPVILRPVLSAISASWALRYLPGLSGYLREHRPDVLLSANTWPNLVAVWARRLAGVPCRTVLSERVHLSARVQHLRLHTRWRHLPRLIRRFYIEADAVVTVSEGVADDLISTTGLNSDLVKALPNPVVSSQIEDLAKAPVPHPWLEAGQPPVILGVGRLHPQKDFPSLLRAFARLRRQRPARLMILGEGAERANLEQLSRQLEIEADCAFPGHVDNPFAYMSRSSVFVLSSRYEGLPGVLIQAMACGCQVVSTDCPSGPQEILRGGELGMLVPVGDADALARGIADRLDNPVPAEAIRQRAAAYSVDAATDAYLRVLLPQALEGPAPATTSVA